MPTDQEAINSYLTGDGSVSSDIFYSKDGILYAYGDHWPVCLLDADRILLNNERRGVNSNSIHRRVMNCVTAMQSPIIPQLVSLFALREAINAKKSAEEQNGNVEPGE